MALPLAYEGDFTRAILGGPGWLAAPGGGPVLPAGWGRSQRPASLRLEPGAAVQLRGRRADPSKSVPLPFRQTTCL